MVAHIKTVDAYNNSVGALAAKKCFIMQKLFGYETIYVRQLHNKSENVVNLSDLIQ